MGDGDAIVAGSAPSPDWARRPNNLARALTDELVGRIVRAQYPSGGTLPPEPVLCQTFSVSRTVVREAVKLLQEKGLVQVRQGSGTTVTDSSMWNMLDSMVLAASIAEPNGLEVLDDLVMTRRQLESDMAYVAARLAGDEAVHELERLVDLMDTLVGEPIAYADQDRAFHDTIMRASGNRIARAVVRALESQVISSARYLGQTSRDLCIASNRGHRTVFERIAGHDAAGASDAMFTHITQAWVVRRGGDQEPARLRR